MSSPTAPMATVMIAPEKTTSEEGKSWLMQLHPLDLERGKIELGREPMVLGRSESCDIQLEDTSVSRQHARIQWSPNSGYEISDLGSTNGVLVNDVLVPQAGLQAGDRLQLGQRIFRFLVDNSKETQYYETVYGMMTRDGLTNAFNKRYLMECLEREIGRCQKFNRPLSVVLIDIDHFKSVNDTYGHLAGDEVLRELSARIQPLMQGGAIFARFGGEEFAIVAVETDLASARELAESCRQVVVAKPFETTAGTLEITISAGVASPQPTTLPDMASILEAADLRLYEAKRGGRNQVVAG